MNEKDLIEDSKIIAEIGKIEWNEVVESIVLNAYREGLAKGVPKQNISISCSNLESMLMRAVSCAPMYKDGLGVVQYDKFKDMVEYEIKTAKQDRNT